ncbi:AmmeMemoRadiSam system protein A [Desulfonatronovibrio hydrogenovorans]|uniref:AmmeMemoRadiSam system protein A n=1 Tax=Desulfonatronovibrio hydrogenovorans TaxID=53245 RepID=UPI00048FA11C|nr:AmmeMemoRadiSam system protein A [Desulfonatronovibrio hydrogenovorans]
MSEFELELTREEKDFLKETALQGIRSGFEPGLTFPDPPTEKLKEKLGAFVTLKKRGMLRGCIGNIVADTPLWKTIARMGVQAAFNDPRFPPLKKSELEEISLEISILSPLVPVDDLEKIEPGRHGLLIRKGPYSGLLLPQVAREYGWDRETFLSQTCGKAGLDRSCWKDPDTEIFWFVAVVF